jgi:hypothetical protein
MKNLLVLFALVLGTVCFTSCEKDEETVDPIVGTWEFDTEISFGGEAFTTLEQWVVKADKTGQFKKMENDEVKKEFSFTWSKDGEVYKFVNKADTTENKDVIISSFFGEPCIITTDDELLGVKAK